MSHFGPFFTIFPDAWFCTWQSSQLKWTVQLLSINWPTKFKLIDKFGDKNIIKERP